MDMNIYVLTRNDTPVTGEWTKCVVIAADEAKARQQADQTDGAGAKGYVWRDGHLVSAKLVGKAVECDEHGVICFSTVE
jgi:hypothetical protein